MVNNIVQYSLLALSVLFFIERKKILIKQSTYEERHNKSIKYRPAISNSSRRFKDGGNRHQSVVYKQVLSLTRPSQVSAWCNYGRALCAEWLCLCVTADTWTHLYADISSWGRTHTSAPPPQWLDGAAWQKALLASKQQLKWKWPCQIQRPDFRLSR